LLVSSDKRKTKWINLLNSLKSIEISFSVSVELNT